jgi:hypothetical protein
LATDAAEVGPWQASQDSPRVGEVLTAAWAAAALVVWQERQAPAVGCKVVM